ncbi:MAG: hypothetical protein EP330_29470 [Deltaproteobacteria bacterium]|nr:MAG: hypothetical protein EP330_29470 [Deltaproteobacteria bacterium]
MPGKPQPASHASGAEHRDDGELIEVVSSLPADVRTVVEGWLAHPRQAARGRCALYGIQAAREAGYDVRAMAARGLIHVEGDGGSAVLAPLAFETRPHEAGSLEDQERLRRALEGAVGERRYVLHIRQPLPRGFDPQPVVQAVALWQHAVRRGEYVGSDAVYQDDGVHIELTLTDVPRGDGPALMLQANPIPGLERMGVVGSILLRLSALHARVRALGPLIPLLSAEPAWRLPRGHAEQVLYGTAAEIVAYCGSEPQYSAVFSPAGALLGERAAETVSAVWWFEPDGNGQVRRWAHENPWCTGREEAPVFPGRRFAVFAHLGDERFRLGWTSV